MTADQIASLLKLVQTTKRVLGHADHSDDAIEDAMDLILELESDLDAAWVEAVRREVA